ncbi:MAG: hypothetical protein H6922_03765 [Pseudomonadaceae bacterium]|nr:hypothetical protein [Pseudomonadaceae bacterium]
MLQTHVRDLKRHVSATALELVRLSHQLSMRHLPPLLESMASAHLGETLNFNGTLESLLARYGRRPVIANVDGVRHWVHEVNGLVMAGPLTDMPAGIPFYLAATVPPARIFSLPPLDRPHGHG